MALPSPSRTLSIESTVLPELNGVPLLVASKLEGEEGLNGLFSYRVTLKTPDERNYAYGEASDIELDGWIGREASVRIELEGSGTFESSMPGEKGESNRGAGQREINGLITEARFLRTEGRHSFYQMTGSTSPRSPATARFSRI